MLDGFQLELAALEGGWEIKQPTDSKTGRTVNSIDTLWEALFRDDRRIMKLSDKIGDDEKIGLIYRYVNGLKYSLTVSMATVRRVHKEAEEVRQRQLL